jgi:drug/metabolite transporter (DMT)-like permease
MSQRSPIAYFGVLMLVNLMWAFQFSGARIATERLGAITVTCLPMVIATVLIAPFALFRRHRHDVPAGRRGSALQRAGGFMLAGIVGIVGAQLGLTEGVQRSLASNASVLSLTIPVFTAVLAALLLGERMTPLRWISFILAIGGVLLVSDIDWRSVQMFRGQYFIGNLLILWSCIGSAFYNTYSKKLLETYTPVEVLVYSFIAADAVLIALMIAFEPFDWRALAGLGAAAWMSLAAIAFFSLAASMLLFFWVIQKIDVTQASLSIYMMPVFGVWIAMITLHEKVTPQLLLGALLVFGSTFLVTTCETRGKTTTAGERPALS